MNVVRHLANQLALPLKKEKMYTLSELVGEALNKGRERKRRPLGRSTKQGRRSERYEHTHHHVFHRGTDLKNAQHLYSKEYFKIIFVLYV